MRQITLIIFGGLLVWLIASKSLAAYLAQTLPAYALVLNPQEPLALLNLATAKFDEKRGKGNARGEGAATAPAENVAIDRINTWAGSAIKALAEEPSTPPSPEPDAVLPPEALGEIKDLVQAALVQDPVNARGLSLLGEVHKATGDREMTTRFMQAATRRSIRESSAVYWLLQRSLDEKDYSRSVFYIDALLRSRSKSYAVVLPALARIAEEKTGNELVKKLLAENPPWRGRFLTTLPKHIADARTPLDLMLSVRDTPHPVSAAERASYLNFLVSKKFYDLAYYAWLQFLTPQELATVGLAFNGSFENVPSGAPFDWSLLPGSGVSVEIAPKPDQTEQRALYIQFGHGRVDFRPVTQLLMLSPGSYELSVKAQGELLGKRGLIWRVTCAGSAVPIAESPMLNGLMRQWSEIKIAIDIPEEGCRAQSLRLELDARSASEKMVSGEMWFDDVAIARSKPAAADTTQQQ